MKDNISSLLFHPFEKGQISPLDLTAKTLFWNLQYIAHSRDFSNLDVRHHFKPEAQIWKDQDFTIQHQLNGKDLYQNIFCTLPQQKDAARYMIAQSLKHLVPSGLLICVAANDAGGKKIESWFKECGLTPHSLSKSKCRIVWTYNKGSDSVQIEAYNKNGAPRQIEKNTYNFTTQPGIFGWDKIDKGSALLIEKIKTSLSGAGADFGCGYGYLSSELLKNHPNISKLCALEADYNALNCAKENLQPLAENTDVIYQWTDLTVIDNNISNLDWIMMNPPFHAGKSTRHDVGLSFIETAYASLRKRGHLYMVANIHLPYEKSLRRLFASCNTVCEENGFKVLVCQK